MTDEPPCAHLDFLIIGAMKAGTTSLFEFLAAQPGVHTPRNKEPHYFTTRYDTPVSWYRSQFRGRASSQITGEASPSYSWIQRYPECPARIAHDAPQARLVYVIRDPVERVLSHHLHGHHHTRPDDDWTWAEMGAYASLWEQSRYRTVLEAYLAHVPAEQILVVDLDHLRADPRWLRVVLRFLDLPEPTGSISLPHLNAADDQLVLTGTLGRVARGRIGSIVRDLVPPERLRRLKRPFVRAGGPDRPRQVEDPAVAVAAIRAALPELCAEVDAEYEWARTTFIEPAGRHLE